MVRPENLMAPEQFYNEEEASKYTNCSRIIKIQSEMAERCLELIGAHPKEEENQQPLFILDIGCGSGLSGSIVEEYGHFWWGIDISESMLRIAQERETNGEFLLGDIGEGFNSLPGFFDAVISVSAIQWLCNEDKKSHDAWKRSLSFFQSVQKCLKSNGKAAFQFYPANPQQMEMLTNAAIKAGLTGGIYIDFPNSKQAKKYYLVLSTVAQGKLGVIQTIDGRTEDKNQEEIEQKKQRKKAIGKNGKFQVKSKYWIYKKKEAQRMQGKETRPDTKYTGRKRKRLL